MLNQIVRNKRAEIGETVTWIVATIVIIAILGISILITSLFPNKDKKIEDSNIQTTDVLGSKSFLSYALTKDTNQKTIYAQLQEEENLNEFNGNLAIDIFKEYHKEEYKNIWVGIQLNREAQRYVKNDYFDERPVTVQGGNSPDTPLDIAYPGTDRIKIDANKFLELVLNNA